MMDKIKSNLNYVLCAGLGLLHFVLMAFRYCAAFAKYDGEREVIEKWTGYGIMKFEDFEGSEAEFLSSLNGILQILLLIVAVGMLLYGALGLLKAFGLFDQFPEQIGKFESKKIASLALIVYAGLSALLLLFMLIWAGANTETHKIMGEKYKVGVSVSFGTFFTLIVGGCAAAAPFVLPKYISGLNEGSAAGPQLTYRCAQCGKAATKNEKFCNACGGTVVAEVAKQYTYSCSKCGKKAKKTDKFCNACGGAIEAVEVKRYEFVCAGCGKKMRKTDKFCNECGGNVIQREIVPVVPAPAPVAPVAPAAPAGKVCPNCGKVVGEANKFCNGCGTAL